MHSMATDDFPPDDLQLNTLCFLAELSSKIENAQLPAVSSIVIGGAKRCGKTTLSRIIAKEMKMFHLRSDHVRRDLYGSLEGQSREWAASFTFREVLSAFPEGLLVEGTAFTQFGNSFPKWGIREDLPVFMIGSTTDYKLKHEAMLSYRAKYPCWTKNMYSESELLNLAKKITSESIANRALCRQKGYHYFEVDPAHFSRDIKDIATKIMQHIS